MNRAIGLLAVLLIFSVSFAQDDATGILNALDQVRWLLCQVLPIVIMLAIVIAAILYAVGQLGSAESRAKFHGWATNIVIGAITALIVLLITPYFLGSLLGDSSMIACGATAAEQQHAADICTRGHNVCNTICNGNPDQNCYSDCIIRSYPGC